MQIGWVSDIIEEGDARGAGKKQDKIDMEKVKREVKDIYVNTVRKHM